MFTGRELDEETGLYYYRARMYDAQLGRFLQTDPVGYFDSMNLYQSCNNNPVRFVDPYGEFGIGYHILKFIAKKLMGKWVGSLFSELAGDKDTGEGDTDGDGIPDFNDPDSDYYKEYEKYFTEEENKKC